jgi:hypothetical protein
MPLIKAWLVPGREYQVSVSVYNEYGNLTVIEQYTLVAH